VDFVQGGLAMAEDVKRTAFLKLAGEVYDQALKENQDLLITFDQI
jgi:hypothetical protein